MKRLLVESLVWILSALERAVVSGWSFVDWLESPTEADEIEIFVSGPVERCENRVHLPRRWH
jgi:hypothetical protein